MLAIKNKQLNFPILMFFFYKSSIHFIQVTYGPTSSPSRYLGTRKTEANALVLMVLAVLV